MSSSPAWSTNARLRGMPRPPWSDPTGRTPAVRSRSTAASSVGPIGLPALQNLDIFSDNCVLVVLAAENIGRVRGSPYKVQGPLNKEQVILRHSNARGKDRRSHITAEGKGRPTRSGVRHNQMVALRLDSVGVDEAVYLLAVELHRRGQLNLRKLRHRRLGMQKLCFPEILHREFPRKIAVARNHNGVAEVHFIRDPGRKL